MKSRLHQKTFIPYTFLMVHRLLYHVLNEDDCPDSSVRGYVKTNLIDVDTSRTPEGGAHSPSWPKELIRLLLLLIYDPSILCHAHPLASTCRTCFLSASPALRGTGKTAFCRCLPHISRASVLTATPYCPDPGTRPGRPGTR